MKLFQIGLLLLSVVGIFGSVLPTQLNKFGYIDGRIVGGQDAEPHSAPWIITMQWGIGGLTTHLCGGSIIGAHWVVSAAHCLHAVPGFGTWVVIAGRHNIAVTETTEQRRNVERSNSWTHAQYTGGVGPFDIGLIRVEIAFDFNEQVSAIALPIDDHIHSGDVELHGWGSVSTSHFPINPNILQHVKKPIIPIDECDEVLGDSPLHDTNVCTGPLEGGISACSGDSGGPLTQDGELVGIVSWGFIPCGSVNAPSVYTRVSAFIDWISENMRNAEMARLN